MVLTASTLIITTLAVCWGTSYLLCRTSTSQMRYKTTRTSRSKC